MKYNDLEYDIIKKYYDGEYNDIQFNYWIHYYKLDKKRIEDLVECMYYVEPLSRIKKFLILLLLVYFLLYFWHPVFITMKL